MLVGGVAAFAAQAQETIRIGVLTDRVGVSKPYSEPATEGLLFGAEEINRRGGVLGVEIELLVEDDQSRPDISAAMARKLIDQGAVFILSMSLTPATQQQQTVTMEAKTPQMTPMNWCRAAPRPPCRRGRKSAPRSPTPCSWRAC